MIFYFSGTGNSYYIAKRFLQPDEELISISDSVNNNQYSFQISQDEKVGFVVPVYNHSLPLIVKKFINEIKINDVNYAYCIFTCASDIGHADTQIIDLLDKRNIHLKYLDSVIMPDNCIFEHNLPDNRSAGQVISDSEPKIKEVMENILNKEVSSLKNPNFLSKIFQKDSSPVLQTNGFYVTDDCINCGMCEKNCPEKAIKIINEKPDWVKTECCKCSACINKCPVKAIQYGKETEKRNRYIMFDTVISVDIYIEQYGNLLIVPFVSDANDISSMSYHYSILEKGYTESDFKDAITKAIDISEKNMREFPKKHSVWTEATGIKSFKSFSKKYSCIMFAYVLKTNTGYIQLLRRESSGAYSPYNDSSKYKKTYIGMPSPETVYEDVMSLMSIHTKINMDNPVNEDTNLSEQRVHYPYLCKKEMYEMSFIIDEMFSVRRCNASELEMVCVYDEPIDVDMKCEPHISIMEADIIYNAINNFKAKDYDAFDFIEEQDNQFLFKAQMDYFSDKIYFYAFERRDAFKGYAGLSLVYSGKLQNTEMEQELHSILDRMAASFEQRKCSEDENIVNDFPLSVNPDEDDGTMILISSLDIREEYLREENVLFNRLIKDASTLYLTDTIKDSDDRILQAGIDFDKKVIRMIMPNVNIKKSQLEQIQSAKEYISKEYNMTLILTVTDC